DLTANRMFVITGTGILSVTGSDDASLIIDGSVKSDGENPANRNVFLVGSGESDTQATLRLSYGVTVRNNTTTAKGGCALVNGKAVLEGAVIEKNSTTDNGGAFQISYNAGFVMTSGTIRYNSGNYGGGINLAKTTEVTISGGSMLYNSAQSGGGNLYVPAGAEKVTVSGGSFMGGEYGSDGKKQNDIAIGNNAVVTFNGIFTCGFLEVRGKGSRMNLTASHGNSNIYVSSTVSGLTAEDKKALFTGAYSSEYGFFRFDEGSMFNDSQNVRIRFFASPASDTAEGWGDCTYIEFPDGTNMLIDCGQNNGTYSAGSAIAKELWSYGIRKIDTAVLTHYHSDHLNGFRAVMEEAKIKIGTFVSSSYRPKSGYSWLDSDLKACGAAKLTVSAGDSFQRGGADFSVLWPESDSLSPVPDVNSTDAKGTYTDDNPPVIGGSLDLNSKTLVIMMSYGGTKILFTGDIYRNGLSYNGRDYTGYDNRNSEEYLVLKYAGTDTLDADIMTAPHHGKRTSSSQTLIDAVSPSFAVAMGGVLHSDVRARYVEAGSEFYLTGSSGHAFDGALNGDVYVKITDSCYEVTAGE
ncbi:MAG: MBL fold metallo-hydrolase, partial [Spirochaetales bacterium]|nr:MBL fold metallo-hydrolase [Spirochaetales bacterium]